MTLHIPTLSHVVTNLAGTYTQNGVNGVNPFFEVRSVNFLYSSFYETQT
jgi:hypothetical protein